MRRQNLALWKRRHCVGQEEGRGVGSSRRRVPGPQVAEVGSPAFMARGFWPTCDPADRAAGQMPVPPPAGLRRGGPDVSHCCDSCPGPRQAPLRRPPPLHSTASAATSSRISTPCHGSTRPKSSAAYRRRRNGPGDAASLASAVPRRKSGDRPTHSIRYLSSMRQGSLWMSGAPFHHLPEKRRRAVSLRLPAV